MFRERMSSTFITINVLSLVLYTCNAFVCYMGQQPDPGSEHRLRWVLPYTHDVRCSCTKILFGGLNIQPPIGWEDHFYTDEPMIYVNNDSPCSLQKLLECNRTEGLNVYACEGHTASIDCNINQVINVTTALYGRKNKSICSHDQSESVLQNVKCEARDALQKVKHRCNGCQSCDVPANNEIFSDPCGGTFKYLQVQYNCEAVCR